MSFAIYHIHVYAWQAHCSTSLAAEQEVCLTNPLLCLPAKTLIISLQPFPFLLLCLHPPSYPTSSCCLLSSSFSSAHFLFSSHFRFSSFFFTDTRTKMEQNLQIKYLNLAQGCHLATPKHTGHTHQLGGHTPTMAALHSKKATLNVYCDCCIPQKASANISTRVLCLLLPNSLTG